MELPMHAFAEFDLLPTLKATLATESMTVPTEIQSRAIPELLGGASVVGIAETGSGKTLAYALPALQLAKGLEDGGSRVELAGQPRVVVVVPTRELGEQVARVCKMFTHETRVRVRSVLGGTTMEISRRNVGGPFEILVATPGRLIQLMDRTLVSLADVRMLILDEADQLLDMGFLADATRIAEACPKGRQLALFSATVSPAVEALIAKLFHHPVVIRSAGSHRVVPTLKTVNLDVVNGKRFPLLQEILGEDSPEGTLIFANTREQCDTLAAELLAAGHPCVVYRGEMDKRQRRANLQQFRDGTVRLLVATDLGSRGLDVAAVGRVVNYHLPHQLENYLHRVGRTARAGRPGLVVNLVTERDRPLMQKVEGARARR
jgi:ATP-dependent RNA helicase RhlE